MPFHEGPDCCLGLCITKVNVDLQSKTPSGSGSYLKHRISKREYKVVLSKTYIRSTLLMLKFQGKGGGVSSCRNASFDLASPVLQVADFEVRSVHESTTSPKQYTTMVTSSTSPRGG